MNQERLAKWQSIASICSSIAIPLILAIVGYIVQDKISAEGLRKDYVQIAISILKERQDEDLRKWAVMVLDENSPIPFSKDVRSKLEQGAILVPVAVQCPKFPDLPLSASEKPPVKWLIETERESLVKGKLDIDRVIGNYARCDKITATLQNLQEWLHDVSSNR
jgi:hypothetical protein